VSTPSTICVNNDLSAGKTSISLRPTDDEKSGRLDLIIFS